MVPEHHRTPVAKPEPVQLLSYSTHTHALIEATLRRACIQVTVSQLAYNYSPSLSASSAASWLS
jgi:hypothetical protein